MTESGTIHEWLGKNLRLELIDGRIIEGKFVCTDREPRIILSESTERWPSDTEARSIGLVIAAGKNIRSIHLLDG